MVGKLAVPPLLWRGCPAAEGVTSDHKRVIAALHQTSITPVAFFLPQFHAIPENDRWWGRGFTEWDLVRKARPLFHGHDHPRVPGDQFGYYRLSEPEVLERQSRLARTYGIAAFCFYHFWFRGKRLLNRPVDTFLRRRDPTMRFCLAWANEPWTRGWDGSDHLVLQRQEYGRKPDWQRHYDALLPAFSDERAIRIGDRPVFLVYRVAHLRSAVRMFDCWRDEAARRRTPVPFIVGMLNGFHDREEHLYRFLDGVCEFAPFAGLRDRRQHEYGRFELYDAAWEALLSIRRVHRCQFRGAFVSWDNTARRGPKATIFLGSHPSRYEFYLRRQIRRVLRMRREHRLLFINAWNEWGEGCYLEADRTNGRGYLRATRNALIAEAGT